MEFHFISFSSLWYSRTKGFFKSDLHCVTVCWMWCNPIHLHLFIFSPFFWSHCDFTVIYLGRWSLNCVYIILVHIHILLMLWLILQQLCHTVCYVFTVPALGGMAIGTQESPRPVAGEDSNVFARKAEMGWTKRDVALPLDTSAREKYETNRKRISGHPGEKQSENRRVTKKREHTLI